MGPGESPQQQSWESLGQETPTLPQSGLFCSCRTDFISAQHRMHIIWYMSSVFQLCPTLYVSIGSSVHGISQARILGWVAISSSRRSSSATDQTCISCVSCIEGFFTINSTWEALCRIQKDPKWLKVSFGELHFKTIECVRKLSLALLDLRANGLQLLMKKQTTQAHYTEAIFSSSM